MQKHIFYGWVQKFKSTQYLHNFFTLIDAVIGICWMLNVQNVVEKAAAGLGANQNFGLTAGIGNIISALFSVSWFVQNKLRNLGEPCSCHVRMSISDDNCGEFKYFEYFPQAGRCFGPLGLDTKSTVDACTN